MAGENPIIRFARPEEDASVGDLLVEAFITRYAQKMPEVVYTDDRKAELRNTAEKRQRAKVWVAEEGGEVVGTVTLWPPDGPGSEAWISGAADIRQLAVRVGHYGRGISDALMDVAESTAWNDGAKAICLHVRRGAEGVARYYLRRGFQREPAGDIDRLPLVFLEGYVLHP